MTGLKNFYCDQYQKTNMPLYQKIRFNVSTQILIWNITETLEELRCDLLLSKNSTVRLNSMKSELHQRAFLSVRKLLEIANYSDFDLYYDATGKPHLKDKCISITHSHDFSALIISTKKVGIDMELQREKILKIASKFSSECISKQNKQNDIKELTVIWGAKEAVFKIRNEAGISFKNNIKVNRFQLSENTTNATLQLDTTQQFFDIHYMEIQNYMLVYAFENNTQKKG